MEKEILSKSNPLIKEIAKLKQKKYRQSTGLVLVEGERLVAELAKRGARFKYLFVLDAPQFEIAGEIVKTTPEVLSFLGQTVTVPEIVGVIELEKQAFTLPQTNFLILDGISDPGNMGTLIRTALAFDFRYVYLLNCVDYTSDKVVRSTMGTILDVNIMECSENEIKRLVSHYQCMVADMGGVDMKSLPKNRAQVGIVLGNEANGVSKNVRDLVKTKVAISMKNDVESLNVAIAGSILMNYFKGE